MSDDPVLTQSPAEAEPVPAGDESTPGENVHHPAKVMRIATMVRQLLEEVRQAPLDEASRARLRDVYETSVRELGEVLSPDLKDELGRLSLPFEADAPTEAELRVAHAQLVGWLEGLFHGIQAMLFAQQAESRARFEEVRRRSLPAAEDAPPQHGEGQYL
ncbi:MAG TPA: proteasome activator [Actinomycetota bacterium]|nr:proteasome activator [Actinomycetota bacterium]